MEINKLLGFYELKSSGLPHPNFKIYDNTDNINCDKPILYTVRTAVYRGGDISLPRAVGVDGPTAKAKAVEILRQLGDNAQIYVAPYFIATKSGTMLIGPDTLIVEACWEDLWNLVDHHKIDGYYDGWYHETKKDAEVLMPGEAVTPTRMSSNAIEGNILTTELVEDLKKYVERLRRIYRNELLCNNLIYLEWSCACESSLDKVPLSEPELVFFELKIINEFVAKA